MLGDGLGDSQSHAGEGFEMTPTAFTRLESAYESHCARLYGEYLDQLDENEARADIEQAFWDALNFTTSVAPLRTTQPLMEPHLSAPCRKAIRKRYSTCSSAPFKSTSNNARSRNTNGAEQIGETHQAVIKADLNRAIQSVMRANTEFRQNFRREEQQLTRSDG